MHRCQDWCCSGSGSSRPQQSSAHYQQGQDCGWAWPPGVISWSWLVRPLRRSYNSATAATRRSNQSPIWLSIRLYKLKHDYCWKVV